MSLNLNAIDEATEESGSDEVVNVSPDQTWTQQLDSILTVPVYVRGPDYQTEDGQWHRGKIVLNANGNRVREPNGQTEVAASLSSYRSRLMLEVIKTHLVATYGLSDGDDALAPINYALSIIPKSDGRRGREGRDWIPLVTEFAKTVKAVTPTIRGIKDCKFATAAKIAVAAFNDSMMGQGRYNDLIEVSNVRMFLDDHSDILSSLAGVVPNERKVKPKAPAKMV